MSKPTAAQVRRALTLADVDIDKDFGKGWYFRLGTSQDYYPSEMSAMIGAVAELERKVAVLRASWAEKKRKSR